MSAGVAALSSSPSTRETRQLCGTVTIRPELKIANQQVTARTIAYEICERCARIRSLMTHASTPAQVRAALGITDYLVGISIGIEDCDDLIADLDFALG
jgi:hypothetical protein